MTHKNQALYYSVKAYVPIAINSIVSRAIAKTPLKELKEEDFFFSRLSCGDELSQLPEYQQCLEALLADHKISSQLDVLIGTNSWRSRSSTASDLMGRLVYMGLRRGKYEFDHEYFEHEYLVFEESFYSDYIIYDVIAPLHNLLVSGSAKLSNHLEISPVTEDDLDPERLSKSKVVRDRKPLSGKPCAVRTRFYLRKVIGDGAAISVDKAEEDREKQSKLNEGVEEVINALRIFEVESLYHSAIIYRTSRWLFRDESVFPSTFQMRLPLTYDRGEEWLRSFERFWQGLQSKNVKKWKFIDLAIRRFGYAYERLRLEDKIVDLLISAEALFLNGTGDEKYRGELQYRLALRASFFLGDDPATRTTIYQHMREAYHLRSKIVHSSASRGKQKKEDGSYINLEEFVITTQWYLLCALRKMINLALQTQPNEKLVNWEELVFSEKNNKRQ